MDSLKEKFEKELTHVPWSALIPHAQKERLFLVDQSVDLIQVALWIAQDSVQHIQSVIDQKQLVRVSSTDKQDGVFQFLIVQPYILAQSVSLPTPDDHL